MRRRGYQRAQGASILKMIQSVTNCGDCNGTGADYDGACRPVACSTCGGNGWIESQAAQAPKQEVDEVPK